VDFASRLLAPSEYPARLRELSLFEVPLYLTGVLPTGLAVAIVGTRHPTPEALVFAHELAGSIATAGIAVISGGAKGIDSAAHEGALAVGGKTLVVAPAAFDHPYPDTNAALFERIVTSGGGYLTQFPPGTAATRAQFFSRNAHLAALSDALVIVESAFRGGARNAVKAARSLSRPVFAVPGAPWNAKAGGCLEEIRLGASILVSPGDILAFFGRAPAAPHEPSFEGDEQARSGDLPLEIPQSCSGDSAREVILRALRHGPRNLDELCSLAGLPPGRLQPLILTLTLEGIVVSDPSGHIRLGSACIC
jgi:DNA processing protein